MGLLFISPFDVSGNSSLLDILWMDEILHHFKTMGNHCLLAFTGESSVYGFSGDAISGFRNHPQYQSSTSWTRESSHLRCGSVPLLGGFKGNPNSRHTLDCYWVGSLDFNVLVEIKVFSTKPPTKWSTFCWGVVAATDTPMWPLDAFAGRSQNGSRHPGAPLDALLSHPDPRPMVRRLLTTFQGTERRRPGRSGRLAPG